MSLRAKLILSTVLEVILVVAVSSLLISSSVQARQASAKEQRANEIVRAITEIRFVTFENLLKHDQRSFEQWESRHSSLLSLLEQMPKESSQEAAIAQKLSTLSVDSGRIFHRLVESYSEIPEGETSKSIVEFQERMATQLLSKQQTEVSDALKIADLAREQSAVVRQRFALRAAVIIPLMLIIAALNFFYVTATITKALSLFQHSASRIAIGDFTYRIPIGKRVDELGHLGEVFNSMAASLHQLDKVKSEFILLASHQLRTPLTAIKWMTEELRQPRLKNSKKIQTDYIARIQQSNERMIELVNELLDASKIGLGKLPVKPEPVQIKTIMEEVIQDVSLLMSEHEVRVTTEMEGDFERVKIDPTWAHIIFQNLLTNAIKYSPAGETVRVIMLNQKTHVEIRVSDHGCGIPKNQQDKIFTKLFRADNARTMIGEGSGLGLYITKEMVEHSGGFISFKSIENKGSTFYVTLPFVDFRKHHKELA